MKVALHVGQLTQAIPGGIGRYTRALIQHLPEDEISIAAFACADTPIDAPPGYKRVSKLNYRLEYELWHRLRSRDLDIEGDVVHAPSLAVPPSKSRPLVVTVNDIAFSRHPETFTKRGVKFHNKALSIARNEASALIVPSLFTRDELVAEGVEKKRIHVIPHGVDMLEHVDTSDDDATIASLGIPKRYILAVGTIEPRKNLPVLVRAVETVRGRGEDLALVLVGPRGWGEVSGLNKGFVYETGKISDDILHTLMRRAIVYCVPSVYEGFGMPVLEAMAQRTAVIASDVSSLPEVVGDAGTLVDPMDASAWAQAIEQIAGDEALRRSQAQRGYLRAKRFTWESSARAHVSAYRTALSEWREH